MVCYLPRFFHCSTDHYHTGCLKGKVSPNISLLVDIPHILIDNPKLRNIKVLVGLFHKIISPPTDCNIPALWSLNLNLSSKTHKFGLARKLRKKLQKKCLFTQGNLKIAWYIFSLSILWLYFPLVTMIQATLSLRKKKSWQYSSFLKPVTYNNKIWNWRNCLKGWLCRLKKCYSLSSSCQESIHFWDSHYKIKKKFCVCFFLYVFYVSLH